MDFVLSVSDKNLPSFLPLLFLIPPSISLFSHPPFVLLTAAIVVCVQTVSFGCHLPIGSVVMDSTL